MIKGDSQINTNTEQPEDFEAANHCFVCGPTNSIGLKITFSYEDGVCRGEFTPNRDHVGYEEAVHGGIVFACIDDVMANVLYLQKRKAYTAKCEIRYRKALQVGQTIKLKGWIVSERKRLIVMRGEARLVDDDSLVASCDASFMLA